MIVLYSNGCPKCKILEKKLNEKNIKFEICEDITQMPSKIIASNKIPWLEVDYELMDFSQANEYINQMGE